MSCSWVLLWVTRFRVDIVVRVISLAELSFCSVKTFACWARVGRVFVIKLVSFVCSFVSSGDRSSDFLSVELYLVYAVSLELTSLLIVVFFQVCIVRLGSVLYSAI